MISNLLQLVSKVIFRILSGNISNSLSMSNIQQLKTRNKKIHKPIPSTIQVQINYNTNTNIQVPIISLPDYDIDCFCLKYGLHHSFIDKIRFIKRDLGVTLESVAANVDEFVSPKERILPVNFNTTYAQIMVTIPKTTFTIKTSHSEITKIL